MRQRIARVRLQLVCDAQVKLLLERFDKDGNGQLDVHEFIGFYAEVKAMYRPARFFSSNAYRVKRRRRIYGYKTVAILRV